MNFADEEYVRLYVSDTVTWKALSWQAKAVLVLALRKFDHAGILEFGRRDSIRALVLATDLPLEVIERGLPDLLAEEIWELEADRFIWPKYEEAQTCKRSARLRKRAERSRRRTESHGVTNGHTGVTNVTFANPQSDNVTDSHPRRGEARQGIDPDLVTHSDLVGSDARVARRGPPPTPPERARPPEPEPPIAATEPGCQRASDPKVGTPGHRQETTPSERNVAPPERPMTRRERCSADLMTCPISELAARCRSNQFDAAQTPIAERHEVVAVNVAWSRAVGLTVRKLGAYSDGNRPLKMILEALETTSEQDLMRACEQASRDDWCLGRKGSDRDPARKRDVGCLTQVVIRRLLDAADATRPSSVNPRVAQMLANEERRRNQQAIP